MPELSHLLASIAAISLLIAASILLLLLGWLLAECLAALLPQPQSSVVASTVKTAILIPAHDEAVCIHQTLALLIAQVADPASILVVADNCTDDTAKIARSLGVSVAERHDLSKRGKGYALDYGLQWLKPHPPDVVLIVDADCWVQPGAVEQLAQAAIATQRPVQATYLMEQPDEASLKDAVSAFAFKVKNLVRPAGLTRLGFPCPLTGTGMAFPWPALQAVNLASGHIVEDMKLGLDLAIAGYPPLFWAEAKVLGQLPQDSSVAQKQRTRWEHGHLQIITAYGLPTLIAAFRQRRLDLGAMGLDLCIPPLSLLVVLWAILFVAAAVLASLTAFWWPLALVIVGGGCLAIAIVSVWLKFGRRELSLKQLFSIPLYVAAKVPVYLNVLRKPQTEWVKTKRDV
ncbi:glycosyltransferase family 2 protein [Almyronema epifaneia]|uniref:Glycosyltransferase n=1 Tax=Almyronema epifaneia S1 TaxID=2991925 RepID=A0ABW6IAV0_9CYAN